MNLKIKIAANTISQLIGKAITTTTTLIATIFIARAYGPEIFGNFTLLIVYIALFYLIADFGFNAIVLEKIQNQATKKEYFKLLLGLRIIWSLILVFISISILAFIPSSHGFNPSVKLGTIIFSLSIISQSLIISSNIIFQNKLRYEQSAISLFTGSFLSLILVIFFSTHNFPLIFIILSFLLGNVVIALTSLFLSKITDPEIDLRPSFNLLKFKEIFQNSVPLGITLVFNLIYFRSDTFILALTKSSADVGNYGLAYRFFETVLVFPTFFMNSLYPLMLSTKDSPENLKSLISKAFKTLLILSLLTTIIFIIIAPNLISISGGALFTQSTTALRLLSLSFPVFFLSSLYMWVLITLGKRKILAFIYGASMVLNIILNIIFIPPFGIPAAALTTLLGETIIMISTYLLSKKYLHHDS